MNAAAGATAEFRADAEPAVTAGRPLSGTRHLVTGGSSGLGAAVVEQLIAAGAEPLVMDLRPPAAEVPHEVVDLSDRRAAESAVSSLVGSQRLDGVITAAGTDACGDLTEVPAEDWERVVAVNLLGAAAVIRAALPALREHRGSVVTVTSTLAERALPAATAYCASKAGLAAFTRALAVEEAGRVKVSAVAPGGMATSFFDGRPEQFKPPPDAQLNDPADVARAILFVLCTPGHCEVRELLVCPSLEPSWP